LAEKFPELTITVQDLPQVQTEFNNTVPEHLTSRVSFQAHSFFNKQTVEGADIYLLKMILHDHSDEDAVKILKALTPALKKGSRVVLLEYIGNRGETDTPLPLSMRQWGTAVDIRLMALFNNKEREVGDWKELFTAADSRYDVADVNAKAGEFFTVVEAVWRG
jgi:hypothetical protein